jgi:hypothetical protein
MEKNQAKWTGIFPHYDLTSDLFYQFIIKTKNFKTQLKCGHIMCSKKMDGMDAPAASSFYVDVKELKHLSVHNTTYLSPPIT